MGLQRKASRHETARTAGVDASQWWDFKPGQRVMTVDGFAGVVAAVEDGPHPGNEAYVVTLDNGMGGGLYTSSQLRAETKTVASVEHTAAEDYPELGSILTDRPDIAHNTVLASKTASASCPNCNTWALMREPGDSCPTCGHQMAHESEGTNRPQDHPWGAGEPVKASKEAGFDPFSLLTLAGTDADFRLHFTASWKDVQNKAKRLRSEGMVRIVAAGNSQIAGEVKGEHAVYATSLQYVPTTQRVATWECGCKWASYSWGRSGPWKKYEGRMCSHALALQYEAQSRGMFGREVWEDDKAPQWLRARTRVVTEYDKDRGENVSRPATPRKRDMNRYHSSLTTTPVSDLVAYAVMRGDDLDETLAAMAVCGISREATGYRAPRANPAHNGVHPHLSPEIDADPGSYMLCSHCHGAGCALCGWDGLVNGHSASLSVEAFDGANDALHEINQGEATPAGHMPSQNPGSSGFLTAPDPGFGHDERYCDSLGIDTAASAKEAAASICPDCWGDENYFGEHADHPEMHLAGEPEDKRLFINPKFDPHAQPDHKGFEVPGVAPMPMHHTYTPERPAQMPEHTTDFIPDYDRLNHLSTLHDEPEAALPETDGTSTDPDGEQSDMDRVASAGSVEDIVAAFQATAGHLMSESGQRGQDSNDIAGAAREALAKMALKDFSPAEQAALINEGAHDGVTASNLDRLDIAGTHYEQLEAALAANDDDDEGWLA